MITILLLGGGGGGAGPLGTPKSVYLICARPHIIYIFIRFFYILFHCSMPVFCLVFHQWREDRLWGSEDGHREVRNHQSHKLVKHCSLLRATPLRVVLELESINSKNAVLAQLQSQCKPGCGMFLAVGVEDQVICLWTIRLFTYNHFSLELEKIHEHVHANVHKGVQAKPCWQDSYPSHWDAGMRQCEKEIMKLMMMLMIYI